MSDREPNILYSSLGRVLTIDGVTVDIKIYRLEHDPQWALEVINDQGTSTVWDALFDTDDEAYAAFQLTVDEEGMRAFIDDDNVIPFPRRS
ncbi:hypothetical protein [Altererythrobacter litoralis]|uniref:Uncharacterized protein n=1 Tax=Altererythrobacter litoralis TaxID=3113904 RepID=A0ABU7GFR1_9SPHN|nr:hypothetical protein [Erythrobacteraceae bacterium 1XM1-14]